MIVNQIIKLLLPLIRSDVQVTRTHIQNLQDQLRSLLAPKMVLVPDALIHCLSDIVIRRRKQRTIRLPDAINREISRYLSIPDAKKYLIGTNLPSGQIKDQVEKRWEQRIKKYSNLIKEGIYLSWEHLIREEYEKGTTFQDLIPFMTALNIPNGRSRSELWKYLIWEQYKKGRMSFQELLPFITAQNMLYTSVIFELWHDLIIKEYEKGTTIQELKPFMTAQNIPYEFIRSGLWRDLIMEEYKKGTTIQNLEPLITAQNIPDEDDRTKLWDDLLRKEYKNGRPLKELKPFIDLYIPLQNIQSKWDEFSILCKFVKKKKSSN